MAAQFPTDPPTQAILLKQAFSGKRGFSLGLPRQNEALSQGRLCFSCDLESSEKKGAKSYFAFDSPIDAAPKLLKCQYLYEVISTPRVKPFLDVEKDLAPGEDFVELESQFICAANSALADLCKIPLKEVENNLVWFSASKKGKKFSLHGILASRS